MAKTPPDPYKGIGAPKDGDIKKTNPAGGATVVPIGKRGGRPVGRRGKK